MFESIIVPLVDTPRSARAIGVASVIGAAAGCPVDLMTAVEPGSLDGSWLHELAEQHGITRARRLIIDDKDAAEAILDLQLQRPGSLLCMSTAARSGVSEVVLGSVAADVVRGTRHALVLVGPVATRPKDLRTLMVCLDGSDVAKAAANTAGVWASMLRSDLHLVRVAPPSEPGQPYDLVNDLMAEAHELRTTLGLHPSWEVLHDTHTADALVRYARELGAGLIVMTTHGRTGRFDRLLGSTAMSVVREAGCPVLVVPRSSDARASG